MKRNLCCYLNRFQRFNIKNVVCVVKRRFLVIKGWETHALEVATIAFLASHHDPHRAPLRQVDRLDDPRDLVDERNGPGDVV